MPNTNPITPEMREADAKWVLRKAPSDDSLARLREATHPEIKNNLTLLEKEAERAARLAALSRAAVKFEVLAELLSGAWFYGDWKAETINEREQEAIMRDLGYWPTTEDEVVARSAARAEERGT